MTRKTSGAATGSIRDAMISGSAWMVVMRWAEAGIGLVSTAILARLLVPEDFGLIGISWLVISLLNILVSFGVEMALIQRQDATDEHFNAAWTLRLLQLATTTAVIVTVSPFAASYFDEPRVTGLMILLSTSVFLSGLQNIGTVVFRKELEFHKEFWFKVLGKFGAFGITVALAVWRRDYWALAWGTVLGQAFKVVLSYAVHPYRPRISFRRIPEIWSFSQWMLLRNIGMYVRRRTDSFFIAKFFSVEAMGLYSVSKEIAVLPTTELVWPMARALFPGYAKLAHDPRRLGTAYLNVLGMITLIAASAGTGLALVAEPLVLILLGDAWRAAVPMIRWLAIFSAALTISASVQPVLMALGHMRRLVGLVWAQAALAVPFIVLAVRSGDIVVVAQVQVVATLLLLPLFFYTLTSAAIVSWSQLIRVTWRPIVASLAMTGCLVLLGAEWTDSVVVELVVRIASGVASFSLVLHVLWLISGRPSGAERNVLLIAAQKLTWLRSFFLRAASQ